MARITITLHIDIPEDASVSTPDVDYQSREEPPHPAGAPRTAPEAHSAEAGHSCTHGPRTFKEGVNKAGKPYKGYFCSDDICAPEWVSTR